MARMPNVRKHKPDGHRGEVQLELDLVGAVGRTRLSAEARLQLRRVYLGVPFGRYTALFCTRSPKYGRTSAGNYAA